MPDAFATPADLTAYTEGAISLTDPRAQDMLDGATAAIRRRCGWNIAPADDFTLILDGGSSVLYLPTLQLNSVTSIVVNGTALTYPDDYEWSQVTGNVRSKQSGGFPDSWGGTVVSFNSGYTTVPADLKEIVLQVVSIALSSPTGATREQAGQVAVSWATTEIGVSGGLSLLARDLAVVDRYALAKEA